MAHAPGGSALLQGLLNSGNTWVFGTSPFIPQNATRIAKAASLATMRRVLGQTGTWVLLDIEHWPMTPHGEQRHPVTTYAQAAAMARTYGKSVVATPAFDLVRSVRPDHRGRIYPEFVRLGLATRIAPYASTYEIQAQGAENNPALYRRLVKEVAHQVHAANPKAVILAGLSTGPSGQKTTAATLYQDVQWTRGVVSGYWLNIPGHGAACPRCTTPQPEVAIKLLQKLERTRTYD